MTASRTTTDFQYHYFFTHPLTKVLLGTPTVSINMQSVVWLVCRCIAVHLYEKPFKSMSHGNPLNTPMKQPIYLTFTWQMCILRNKDEIHQYLRCRFITMQMYLVEKKLFVYKIFVLFRLYNA